MHYLFWLCALGLFGAAIHFADHGDVTVGAFAIASIGWAVAGGIYWQSEQLYETYKEAQRR